MYVDGVDGEDIELISLDYSSQNNVIIKHEHESDHEHEHKSDHEHEHKHNPKRPRNRGGFSFTTVIKPEDSRQGWIQIETNQIVVNLGHEPLHSHWELERR